MKLIFFLTITLFITPAITNGQTKTESKPSPDIFKIITAPTANQGKITIYQSVQIANYINRYIEIRRKDNTIPGYRIRIYANSGQSARSTAYNMRERFISQFPDIPAEVDYDTPNFRVYVGDFRSKNEAFRALQLIKKEFKNAFIVPVPINLPKL
jgi:hypothetical protein